MIPLDHQIVILADVELNFKEEMLKGNWKEFFDENNVGIPLSTMLTLGLAELPSNTSQRFYADTLIRKSFSDFCEHLDIPWDKNWVTAQHMFDHSENERISEDEQEEM